MTLDLAPAPITAGDIRSPERGLSESEVRARRAAGQGNNAPLTTSRTYPEILRAQAVSFINIVLFCIGLGLVLLGRPDDAFMTAGIVLLNVIVGVGQEVRAKRQLDHIALLTRPQATVIREGREQSVDPSALVLGDLLIVRPGDQIVLDGTVVRGGRMEVDESLLTGESDRVPKQAGDAVYSGSFCVTGSARYVARQVGAGSLANQITASARAFRQVKTPLQCDVEFVVRLLVVLVLLLGLLLGLAYLINPIPVVQQVQIAAVLVALVPQGLFAMITVTYAMGALRMAGKGALIQQINAVESLSNVTVLCLDKTGTLTSNTLKLAALVPLGITEQELTCLLGDYVASISAGNRTAEALGAACAGQARPVREEVVFSSAQKWSAVIFAGGAGPGVYVLGAPEILEPNLQPGSDLGPRPATWADQGLRVLLFAYCADPVELRGPDGEPVLPGGLIPLGLVSLRDELRAEAHNTLQAFAAAGVHLKIISGDHPQTVAALARQAGLGVDHGDLQVVSGLDLADMDEAAFARAAAEATIFGRITPAQKEHLVRCLQAQGHYVAMIGDGVNDVLSLKRAQLAVAMQSGSQATRSVADIVLLGDSFAILPAAVQEGRRIISGMQDVMRLVLAHTFYIVLVILFAAIVDVAFPTTPKLRSLITLLSVGIPTMAIAAWARPDLPPGSVLRSVLHFVVPAAFTVSAVSFAVYLVYLVQTGDLGLAQAALTTIALLCGLVLVVFVEPPTPAWVAGDALSGDWRPAGAALAMLGLYGVAMYVPLVHDFYGLTPLPLADLLLLTGVTGAWALVVRTIWRTQLFERLLRLRGRTEPAGGAG